MAEQEPETMTFAEYEVRNAAYLNFPTHASERSRGGNGDESDRQKLLWSVPSWRMPWEELK